MPYYYFDLVVGEEFKNQGGIILEDLDVASDRAHQFFGRAAARPQAEAGRYAGLCAELRADADRATRASVCRSSATAGIALASRC